MFNLFKKKEGSVKVIDKVWMTQQAKWNGILELWKKDPSITIIAWFDSTAKHLETLFATETTSPPSIFSARTVPGSHVMSKKIVFAEHHPIRKKEQDVFSQWHLNEALIYSALDEPLFKHFGGDKIIQMMKQLGMKEDSMIEHKMVSKAIENAQEKIEKKVIAEQDASSPQKWIERNL
jgi:hypothetical protein